MPGEEHTRNVIDIHDRAFCYGDGLFETILLEGHGPVLLDRHIQRMTSGADVLRIPLDPHDLATRIDELSGEFPAQGVLKIVLSRGSGGRGYRPPAETRPTLVLSLHPLPDYTALDRNAGVDAFVCRQRLARQPALAGLKHLNRLEQVMASLEWPGEDCFEGLMQDTAGNIIEGTRSNLFWVEAGQLYTPDLSQCGVAGVMRGWLLERFDPVPRVQQCSLERLLSASEVFLCNSIVGVWPIRRLAVGHDTKHFSVGGFSRRAGYLFDQACMT